MLLELLVQQPAIDIQPAGSLRFIAIALLHRGANQTLFPLRHGFVKRKREQRRQVTVTICSSRRIHAQMFRRQHPSPGIEDRGLYHVLELADISRKPVLLKREDGIFRKPAGRHTIPRAENVKKMFSQRNDVGTPGPEWRERYGKGSQTEIEILAKGSVLNIRIKITIGGRDQAEVGGHGCITAYSLKTVFL